MLLLRPVTALVLFMRLLRQYSVSPALLPSTFMSKMLLLICSSIRGRLVPVHKIHVLQLSLIRRMLTARRMLRPLCQVVRRLILRRLLLLNVALWSLVFFTLRLLLLLAVRYRQVFIAMMAPTMHRTRVVLVIRCNANLA